MPERSDPTQALGPAESPPGNDDPIPTGTFYSLGFGGDITLGFDNPICNAPGADLAIDVREITMEPWGPERAQVYVSADGVSFTLAGTVTKDGQVPMPASVPVANFVRLVDVSNPADFPLPGGVFADGFDLDGVRSLSNCPPGKIEICKAAFNGMTNRPFQFSLNGGTPITVRGGRCTGPIATTSGLNTIRELETTPPTDVKSIAVRPSGRLVSQDLAGRTVKVTVVPGSTAATETRVTFTNQPGGGNNGDLKICKLSETPQYWGRQFSFRVNGGPAFSTEANPAFDPPSSWTCRLAGSFRVGSRVTVQEDIPAGAEIAFIDTDPGDRLLDFDTTEGTALVEIGAGTTIVLYDNEAIPPAQSGYIEVCKDAAHLRYERDPFVKGPYTFTVDPAGDTPFDVTVEVGQCTEPLQVAAGNVRVTEHQRPNQTLVDAFTIPEERLLDSNLINGTVAVEVPVSDDPNDETQVHFVNKRERAQLKVCKALAPASDALAGQEFYFDVRLLGSVQDGLVTGVGIVASAANTQCRIVDDFPVGEQVTVDEIFGPNIGELDGRFDETGSYIDVSGEVTEDNPLTIRPGVNTVTITNKALGKLEICKIVTDPISGNESYHEFRFHIDGGPAIKVRPNRCSPPQLVSVGEHVVSEDPELNYEVTDIETTPADAEVSDDDAGRSVTVDVPYAGDRGTAELPLELGREVRVDFYNRIKRAQIKVCKHISPGSEDAIGMTPFNFSVTTDYPGRQGPYSITGLRGGECALARDAGGDIVNVPVIRPDGSGTTAQVDELLPPGVGFPTVTVQGGRTGPAVVVSCNVALQAAQCIASARWTLGPNTNTVHFTNRKGDLPAAG